MAERYNYNIEEDIISLIRKEPFYGRLILSMRREEFKIGYAAGISVKGGLTLRYNPDILSKKTPNERMAILEHEALHVINRHFSRLEEIKTRKSIFRVLGQMANILSRVHKKCLDRLWNYAADLSINKYIEGIPECALLPEKFNFPEGLSAEEYLALLIKDLSETPDPSSGNDKGSSEGKVCPICENSKEELGGKGDLLDDHSGWEGSQADKESAEALTVSILKECSKRGLVPSKLESLVRNALKPRINWKAVIRTFVCSAKSTETTRTWMRVNRRLPFVIKGKKKIDKASLIVGIDTSGTISDEMLEEFSAELRGIARECEEIIIIQCDACLQDVSPFKDRIYKYKGRGGTAFTPVFDYISDPKNRLSPDAIIYFTDGFGDNPAPFRKAPVLWVVSPKGQRPAEWGRVLFLPE